MMDAEAIARWSAWPAVICYVAMYVVYWISREPSQSKVAIWLWTAGWIALVAHIIVAFGTVHGWSWNDALEHTARRTRDAVGWDWSGGVWLNLLTALIWGGDVIWLWTAARPCSTESPGWRWHIFAQAFVAFMLFNAVVVFGSSFAQFAGCLVCIGLAALANHARRKRRIGCDDLVESRDQA